MSRRKITHKDRGRGGQELRSSLKNLIGVNALVGVEIGVAQGYYSVEILETLDIKKLYLVDPWEPYPVNNGEPIEGHGMGVHEYDEGWIDENSKKIQWESVENPYERVKDRVKKYGDRVELIKDLSENAVDRIPNNLDFVYIDGLHLYEYVKKDIELYYPKVKVGGMICGHDYCKTSGQGEVGVFQAVNEFFNNQAILSPTDDEDWWYIKTNNKKEN